MNRPINRKVLIALTVAVLVVGGFFAARTAGLFSDDPAEVSLTEASDSPTGGDVDFEGDWTVAGDSFAGYRIEEEFAGIGANTAVGRTTGVDGSMTIEGDRITGVDLTVDLTTLRSDRDMRDNALRRRGLETDTYPTASFELSEPVILDEEPAEGEQIETEVTGDFTLHGVTRRVTIPIDAKWSGSAITVVSSFEVDLDDHEIERPTTARVVSIADTGTVELQANFEKA